MALALKIACINKKSSLICETAENYRNCRDCSSSLLFAQWQTKNMMTLSMKKFGSNADIKELWTPPFYSSFSCFLVIVFSHTTTSLSHGPLLLYVNPISPSLGSSFSAPSGPLHSPKPTQIVSCKGINFMSSS